MIRQILRKGRDAERGEGGPKLSAVQRPPIKWLDPPPGPWTVERAYAYCEDFARAHTESYPVASRFVPPRVRPHLVALYAFARSAARLVASPTAAITMPSSAARSMPRMVSPRRAPG